LQQGELSFASGLLLSLPNSSRRVKSIWFPQSAALAVFGFLVALRAGLLCHEACHGVVVDSRLSSYTLTLGDFNAKVVAV